MALSTTDAALVPSHVPPELVKDFSVYLRPNTRVDPFSLTENIYEELPPVFYAVDHRNALLSGSWFVTRHADIRDVYQNERLYSTRDTANFQTLVGETFRMIPLAVDPPEHGKYRVLLNPWFSPRAINELESSMRETIVTLIDRFADMGEADLAYDFGRLYPVRVFMNLMGFPPEKLDDFLNWEYAILHSGGDLERVKWGIGSAVRYLRAFIEETRERPAKNLTSHIVHGQVDGRPLTEDEIIGTVAFLWLGGLDTVAATTAHMFRRLALQPELQDALRADPDRHADAIEEFLRVQPLVNSWRLVKEDHEIRGVRIKAGDYVTCFNSAGNFDPEEFESPREVRFDRPFNRHFTLAGGPHRCLGSHLARRELRIALSEVLSRLPRFRIKPDADLTAQPGLVATPRVPVVWDR